MEEAYFTTVLRATATPEGIEPSHMASKATALSTELRGLDRMLRKARDPLVSGDITPGSGQTSHHTSLADVCDAFDRLAA